MAAPADLCLTFSQPWAAGRMSENPADVGAEGMGLEGLDQIARALVVRDVGQAAGTEGHNGSTAGVGF
jgi:hypothetical protein